MQGNRPPTVSALVPPPARHKRAATPSSQQNQAAHKTYPLRRCVSFGPTHSLPALPSEPSFWKARSCTLAVTSQRGGSWILPPLPDLADLTKIAKSLIIKHPPHLLSVFPGTIFHAPIATPSGPAATLVRPLGYSPRQLSPHFLRIVSFLPPF